jgi:YD repeat-containing protein
MNYRYRKAVHRQIYLAYRKQNFTDPVNTYQTAHNAAKAAADIELKPILELQDRFQNPVIEESNLTDSKLHTSNFTRYDFVSNPAGTVQPQNLQAIHLTKPANSFTNASVSGYSLSKDSRYENEAILKYDKGHVVEVVNKDGLITSWIYGYNNEEPVAKIVGASYVSATALINNTLIQSPAGDAALRSELNKLRVGLSSFHAQVTTYTYTKTGDLTSETDPGNHTTFYEYDALGRLSNVKDQDGNVLKKICYGYSGLAQSCGFDMTPLWTSTGTIRCQPCSINSAYTSGHQEHEEEDRNANSRTFGSKRWVDDGLRSTCAVLPDWRQSNYSCITDASGQTTGNASREETDVNPCSPSFNSKRTTTVQDCSTCPKPQNWQPTGNYQCAKDAGGNNTGEQLKEVKNVETCSIKPGKITWVSNGSNLNACPLPLIVYAKITEENGWSSGYGSYADIVVRFYSDAACTKPYYANGINFNWRDAIHVNRCHDSYDDVIDNSMQVWGTSYTLLYNTETYYFDYPCTETIHRFLPTTGTGYTIVY